MLINLIAKIKHKFKFFLCNFPFGIPNPDVVIFIRHDAVGDYILTRNLIHFLCNSEKYKNKKVYYVGNASLRGFYEADSLPNLEYICVDFKRFYHSYLYRISLFRQINGLRPYEVINPMQEQGASFPEAVVAMCNAKIISGNAGDHIHRIPLLAHSKYTRLNEVTSNDYFEFIRNKDFFEFLTGETINITKPDFQYWVKPSTKDTIIIFPGAQAEFRRWSKENFTQLINKINLEFPNKKFLILGGSEMYQTGQWILENTNSKIDILNLCGKTTLIELVKHINDAVLLLSNETSAVHIAAATNTECICISNGYHFLRFSPYPKMITEKNTTVYPDDTFYNPQNFHEYYIRFKASSDLKIDSISVERVFGFVNVKLREIYK